MNHLDVAAQASAVITLIALGWLAYRAFGKHPGWGLAVLLLSPLAALGFGYLYWKEAKRPLMLYAASLLATLILALALFSAWGGWELLQTGMRVHQGMRDNTLASRDASNFLRANLAFADKSGLEIRNMTQAEYARRQVVMEALEAAEKAAATETDTAVEEVSYQDMRKKAKSRADTPYRLVYLPIKLSDAHQFIGATVKVTRKNVVEKEYRLTGVSGNRLQFAQRNRSGNFSFSFRTRDIEKLRVLIKQPR